MKNLKLAIVHDDFIQNGGAELFVFNLIQQLKFYSNLEITVFSSIISKDWEEKLKSLNVQVEKSFLSSFPYSDRLSKLYFLTNLFYMAFESFDFSDYDVVISSSTRFGHSVITKPNTRHISYINSPSKMLWEIKKYYVGKRKLYLFIKNFLPNKRTIDFITQQRADVVVSNSYNIAHKLKKFYQRDSLVLYPFIDIVPDNQNRNKKEFYILISRLIPWKRIDFVIETFNSMPDRELLIVGKGDRRYIDYLKSISNSNIKFLGFVSSEEKTNMLSEAKGLIVPQDEDFGLIIPESLILGTPIIYFNKGGAKEILSSKYGQGFEIQDSLRLLQALNNFEKKSFNTQELKEYGSRFTSKYFIDRLFDLIKYKL